MNPLDQLADITQPQQVSMWPLAWGYWVLIAIALALCVVAIVAAYKYRKHYAHLRLSIAKLASLETTNSDLYVHFKILAENFYSHYYPLHKVLLSNDASQPNSFMQTIYQHDDKAPIEALQHNIFRALYANEHVDTTQAQRDMQVMQTWLKNSVPTFGKRKGNNKQPTMGAANNV